MSVLLRIVIFKKKYNSTWDIMFQVKLVLREGFFVVFF